MKGSMFKKGEKRRNWLERWFTLENGALCYYEKQDAKSPKGFILTKDITDVRGKTSEKVGSKSGKGDFVFEVVTKARTYYLAPVDAKLRDEWTTAIKSWIGYNEDVSTKEQPKPGASNRAASAEKAIDDKELAAKTDDAAAAAGGASASTSTDASTSTTATATTTTTSTDSTAGGAATPSDSPTPTSESVKPTDSAAPAAAAASAEKKDDEQHSDDEKPAAGGDAAASSSSTSATSGGGDAPAASENEIVKYEAQYDYDAQEENELSFKEGDIVTVLDTFKGAGWWKAELNGKIGLIPGNFFNKVK